MLRWSVLLLAVGVNVPVLWQALIDQTLSVETALTHLLITVPVVAVLLAGLRLATHPSRGAARGGALGKQNSGPPTPLANPGLKHRS